MDASVAQIAIHVKPAGLNLSSILKLITASSIVEMARNSSFNAMMAITEMVMVVAGIAELKLDIPALEELQIQLISAITRFLQEFP